MIFFQKQVQIVEVFTYEVDLPFDSSTGLSTATKSAFNIAIRSMARPILSNCASEIIRKDLIL